MRRTPFQYLLVTSAILILAGCGDASTTPADGILDVLPPTSAATIQLAGHFRTLPLRSELR